MYVIKSSTIKNNECFVYFYPSGNTDWCDFKGATRFDFKENADNIIVHLGKRYKFKVITEEEALMQKIIQDIIE